MMKHTIAITAAILAMLIGFGFTLRAMKNRLPAAQGSAQQSSVTALQTEAAAQAETAAQRQTAPVATAAVTMTQRAAAAAPRAAAQMVRPAATKPAASVSTTASSSKALIGPGKQQDFIYTDDADCWWNSDAASERMDDFYAPSSAMFVDQVFVCLPYDGQDWMIRLCKGQYGWLYLGGEISVTTAPAGTQDINRYTCPEKSDWLKMSMQLLHSEDGGKTCEIIGERPYEPHWWINGYKKGQLKQFAAPRTELKLGGRITFPSDTMAQLFAARLNDAGFAPAAAKDRLTDDTYFRSGEDVYLLWKSVTYHAFPAPAPTTAAPATTALPQEPDPAALPGREECTTAEDIQACPIQMVK